MLPRRSGIFVLSLLCACFVSGQCQDQSGFTQFYINPSLLNPSYAGIDGQPSASLLYRKQWMTIDGAPAIASLTFQAPLKGALSGALNVANESIGFFRRSAISFSAAYYVALREQLILRFGISAGGSWNTVDMKKLDGINDPALSGVLEKNAALTGNAGVSLHSRSFNFGVALPALFSPVYVSEDAFNTKEIKPFQSLLVHASNRFYFNNDKNVFEPYIVYRLNQDLPSQLEVAGIVHLNHLIWAGGSYRQHYGVSALGGIKLGNRLAIGGSYSIQQQSADKLSSPSFEASLSYLFGKRQKGIPVYSFVNDVKPKERVAHTNRRTVVDKAKAAPPRTKATQPPADNDPIQENKPVEKPAAPQTEPSVLTERLPPVEAPKKEETPVPVQTESQQRSPSDEVVPADNIHSQDPAGVDDQTQRIGSAAEKAAAEVRHETVERANNKDELEAGEYVIAGVFKSSANAKHFSDGLHSLDYRAGYGYVTEKDLWYVYLFKSQDAGKARAEQAKLSKLFLLRDAWLLTVQPNSGSGN